MENFTVLDSLQSVMLVGTVLVQLAIPASLLVASFLAIHRTAVWIAVCLVVGASIRFLCGVPSALYPLLLHNHINTAQYGVISVATGLTGFVSGGLFVAGFFGLVLERARGFKPS